MTIDTARLRALAEAALNADDACDRAETEGARSDELQAAINDAEDATQDFRNAATPENILALLDERDAMERERDEAREALRQYKAYINESLNSGDGSYRP
jgi:hypothetical protein